MTKVQEIAEDIKKDYKKRPFIKNLYKDLWADLEKISYCFKVTKKEAKKLYIIFNNIFNDFSYLLCLE